MSWYSKCYTFNVASDSVEKVYEMRWTNRCSLGKSLKFWIVSIIIWVHDNRRSFDCKYINKITLLTDWFIQNITGIMYHLIVELNWVNQRDSTFWLWVHYTGALYLLLAIYSIIIRTQIVNLYITNSHKFVGNMYGLATHSNLAHRNLHKH